MNINTSKSISCVFCPMYECMVYVEGFMRRILPIILIHERFVGFD